MTVAPPADGAWAQGYTYTPFEINITINTVDGQPMTNGPASFTIDGTLGASEGSGAYLSLDLWKQPGGIQVPAVTYRFFQYGTSVFELEPAAGQWTIFEQPVGASFTIPAEVDAVSTPEPSTLLIFGAVGAVALLRLSRRARS
jgi:PEP-CTERM motif